VINIDLHTSWHTFQVVADYWPNFRFRQGVHTRFRWLRTTKFGLKKLETSVYRMTLTYWQTIISLYHNALVCRTDRLRYRQQDLAF